MKKTEAITENYIFRRLYRRAKSAASPCLAMYCCRVKGRKYNRLGITATKKLGCAVKRNRARRVIKEAYRLLEDEIPTGRDFVAVARQRASAVKMQTVKEELRGLIRKLERDNP
ncbi:MAG: ribonuclease P protein component [Oscillospiraceae bacterium]|nr:ribonuclease P protein component [Oscillospiraceae bacterium]